MCYCKNCGKPAKYHTKGYVSFICEDCFDKSNMNKYKEECRLTKDDIPVIEKFINDKVVTVNIKKEYGIDFEKMWRLK